MCAYVRTYVGTVCDKPFLRNETKTERPFPLYETPHPFRRNKWTVLKRFVAEKRSQNDSSLNKTMKNDSRPFAAPSRPVAAAPSRLAATPLRPVHLLPLVKGRNDESSPKLRVYGAPNRICGPRDQDVRPGTVVEGQDGPAVCLKEGLP